MEEHRLEVLWKVFGPERDTVTGDLRTLLSEERHRLYCSPSIIWAIKSRRMRWAGHVARTGDNRNAYRFWWAKLKKRNLEDPDVGRIVLTRLLNRMTESGMD
jgi:hypothetical protein